jgi:hypothetical protein
MQKKCVKDNTSVVAGSGYPKEKSQSLSLFLYSSVVAEPTVEY